MKCVFTGLIFFGLLPLFLKIHATIFEVIMKNHLKISRKNSFQQELTVPPYHINKLCCGVRVWNKNISRSSYGETLLRYK